MAKIKNTPKAAKGRPAVSTLVKRLDKVFSQYIRLRDAMEGGYFKCISCGKVKPIDKADCGHYFSRRHMATRFDEDNCNAECSYCNRFGSDHLDGYRHNLIKKIGPTRFQMLAVRRNETRKWSAFELEAMIKHYRDEVKRLEKDKGIKL